MMLNFRRAVVGLAEEFEDRSLSFRQRAVMLVDIRELVFEAGRRDAIQRFQGSPSETI